MGSGVKQPCGSLGSDWICPEPSALSSGESLALPPPRYRSVSDSQGDIQAACFPPTSSSTASVTGRTMRDPYSSTLRHHWSDSLHEVFRPSSWPPWALPESHVSVAPTLITRTVKSCEGLRCYPPCRLNLFPRGRHQTPGSEAEDFAVRGMAGSASFSFPHTKSHRAKLEVGSWWLLGPQWVCATAEEPRV